MQFEKPLARWNFARREKRFFIYGAQAGQVAHCANTGSMKTLLEHAAYVWVRDYGTDTKRTLRYGAELLELHNGTLAVINTAHANTLAGEALRAGLVNPFGPLQNLQPEVKYSPETRFDWAAETAQGQRIWIEVKNVTMGTAGVAQFPDAITERGTKHLHTLTEIVKNGGHALQIYMVTRTDAHRFSPAAHIDATYTQALKTAVAAGVQVVALGCKIKPQAIEVCQTMPIVL
jgi:sugar fermentation stimulation protein A